MVQGYQKHDLNAEENWITKGVRVGFSLHNMVALNGQQRLGLFSPLTGSVFMVRADVLQKLRFEEVITENWNLTMGLYENGYKILYDGVPIIATDLPEFRELAEDGCGMVLSLHDPEALAERIEQILNNPDLARELRERNLRFAQERTWDKIASLFCKVYEQIKR